MAYIRDKALNVILKSEEIDEMLNEHVTGWKTSRMNKVDLSILRLAVYEMKYDEDVPVGVAINEAVELAKNTVVMKARHLSMVCWPGCHK